MTARMMLDTHQLAQFAEKVHHFQRLRPIVFNWYICDVVTYKTLALMAINIHFGLEKLADSYA